LLLIENSFSFYRDKNRKVLDGFDYMHMQEVAEVPELLGKGASGQEVIMSQALGEAITLFRSFILSSTLNKAFGAYYFQPGEQTIYLELNPKGDYKRALHAKAQSYRVKLDNNTVYVAALNENGRLLSPRVGIKEELIGILRLYTPIFLAMLAREVESDSCFKQDYEAYALHNEESLFNKIYTTFYLKYLQQELEFHYVAVNRPNVTGWKATMHVEGLVSVPEACLAKAQPKFSPEQEQEIPRLSREEFILDERLENISRAIEQGDIRALLLHGPAGTGKTMACKLIAREIEFPVMATINCTENLDEFVLGKYIPREDKFIFQESEVTAAIRYGGIVVFEEINFAKPQYLAFLNSLLDDNGFVRLDDGTRVNRSPNFRFFATMNMGYFGTKELNQALYNRFNCIVEVEELSDEAIQRMLIARVPECKTYIAKILKTYHKIRHMIEQEELDVVISPRNLENWVRLAKYEGYKKAAESTIIPIAKEDKDLANSLHEVINTFKWDD